MKLKHQKWRNIALYSIFRFSNMMFVLFQETVQGPSLPVYAQHVYKRNNLANKCRESINS